MLADSGMKAPCAPDTTGKGQLAPCALLSLRKMLPRQSRFVPSKVMLKLENLVRATGGKNSEQICSVLERQHDAQRQTGPLWLRRHASDQHCPHRTLGRAFNPSGSQLSHRGNGHTLCSFGLGNDLRMTFSSLTVSLGILKLPHCPCHSAFSSGLRVMLLMKTPSFKLKVLLQLLKGMCKILIQKFRVTVNLFIKKKKNLKKTQV